MMPRTGRLWRPPPPAQERRNLQHTLYIFLTAKTERTDFRKGMEMGADDYVTKPFEEIELLNAIETA